jgi:hypothetical protein
MVKRCSRCREERERAAFSKHPAAGDGLQAWCKLCFKEYWRQARRRLRAAAFAADAPARRRDVVPSAGPSFSVALRPGCVVRVFNIPGDLTAREAGKIERIVMALAVGAGGRTRRRPKQGPLTP